VPRNRGENPYCSQQALSSHLIFQLLCERFEIPDEAAGASFLAFGSAAPEIMINIAAVSSSGKVEASISAIMGSAIIAYGLIPPAAFFSVGGDTMVLQTYPGKTPRVSNTKQHVADGLSPTTCTAIRDVAFYLLSMFLLLHFLKDSSMGVPESSSLVVVFVVYMLVVYLVPKFRGGKDGGDEDGAKGSFEMPEFSTSCGIEDKGLIRSARMEEEEEEEDGAGDGGVAVEVGGGEEGGGTRTEGGMEGGALALEDDDEDEAFGSVGGMEEGLGNADGSGSGSGGDDDDDNSSSGGGGGGDDDDGDCWESYALLDLASKPCRIAYRLTIPDMEKSPRLWPVGLVISLVYVAVLSDVVYALTLDLSEVLNMPDELAGVTLLALGAQIPDTIASIAMARAGMPDGAISNAVGSQIINITIGVGFPFLIYSIVHGKPVHIEVGNITVVATCLGATVMVYLFSLFAHMPFDGAKINKFGGVIMVLGYFVCNVEMAQMLTRG
jgi:Ca2+/Na+ antiporter